MKSTLLAAALLLPLASAPAHAKTPIVIIESGVRTGYGREGVIDFAKDFEVNPRDLTLEILGHPFGFDVNGAGCGASCTFLNFTSVELGINMTFTGANTAEVSKAFQNYIKSQEFLKPFIRLINSGAGSQISGSPAGAVGSAVRSGFQDTMFQAVQTQDQRDTKTIPGQDPQFSGGFAQFSTDGYQGKVLAVTPGFSLDFGERRNRRLKISFPVARVELEGLRTYRGGLALQYLHPIAVAEGWTMMMGPGVSYQATASADLPNFSGLLGGAFSTALQRDWDRWFATGAGYYGRFNNLGGIDTDIQANIYGWGAQAGRRLAQRWVASLQLVGIHERAAGFTPVTYHTLGVAATYKILNRFDLTLSANKMIGLPRQRFVDVGLGSAWFF